VIRKRKGRRVDDRPSVEERSPDETFLQGVYIYMCVCVCGCLFACLPCCNLVFLAAGRKERVHGERECLSIMEAGLVADV